MGIAWKLAKVAVKLTFWPVRLGWRAAFGNANERRGKKAELEVVGFLKARGIPCLHDVFVKHANGVWTQIDVLCFLGDRIGVIEVKAHRGRISVSDSSRWGVDYGNGRKEWMDSPVRQNIGHCKAVRAAFHAPCEDVVVFTDGRLDRRMEGVFEGVPPLMMHPDTSEARTAWEAICRHDATIDKNSVRKTHLKRVKSFR